MIVVIDLGTGNLQSVARTLRKAGGDAKVSVDADDVEAAEKIVLPGVGAADVAMQTLRRHALIEPLTRQVLHEQTPLLGICLGLQLLTRSSEEGGAVGLGWINARTVRLRPTADEPRLKIPHMGWNTIEVERPCPLFAGIPEDACFYFAHSYAVQCDDAESRAAATRYGVRFVSVIHHGNIFGVQFHPEKSHANGLAVLRNFVEYR